MTALGDFSSGDVLTAADMNAIGTWQTWSPNVRAEVGTWGGVTLLRARYCEINKLIVGQIDFQITSVGTGDSGSLFDLPVTAASSTNVAIGIGREHSLNGYTVNVYQLNTATASIRYYSNTATANNLAAPSVIFTYEAA